MLAAPVAMASERYVEMCALFLLLWSHGGVAADAERPEKYPVVRVEQGFLRGRRVDSQAGGFYFSFQGVPYARPPVGPLRFKDAEPPEPWASVRDALGEGSACTQFDVGTKDYGGQEDCLFLNVYTPRLPTNASHPLPVMMFIHGGGFVFGSGNSDWYGPDFLVNEEIILVTINYRLGPFGFLYLGEAAPGNAGLKDQVQALRWLQKNIAAFGGDPTKVTIFGESAGGVSVHHHMMSPLSKGLFHRAIAQSGALLNPWAIQNAPEETTWRLARAVGCLDNDTFAVVECLRGVGHLKLMQAAKNQAPTERDRERLLKFTFVPTSEYPTKGVETFVSDPFDRLVTEGRHQPIPFMTGLTSQEALVMLALNRFDFLNGDIMAELDAAWDKKVLPELRIPIDAMRSKEALDDLRQFFLDGKTLSAETMQAYIDMFSDLLFGEGVIYSLNHMAKFSRVPLYLYSFTIDDELNLLKRGFGISWPGASHADEIGYLFSVRHLQGLPDSAPAALARRQVVRLWANFAKTGNPTPPEDNVLDVHWLPYTDDQKNFLEIGQKLRPDVNLYAKRMNFWEEFYLKYSTRNE